MICAWIDTSSDATGSSQTSASGRIASARAMATRWRWPPENWCGNRSRRSPRPDPTAASQRATSLLRLGLGDQAMRERTLGNDVADAHARIERRERVLKHHLDARGALAAGGHHGLAGEFRGTQCWPRECRPPRAPAWICRSPTRRPARAFRPSRWRATRLSTACTTVADAFAPVRRLASRSVSGGTDVNRRVTPARLMKPRSSSGTSAGATHADIQRVVAAPDPCHPRKSRREACHRRWWRECNGALKAQPEGSAVSDGVAPGIWTRSRPGGAREGRLSIRPCV